MDRPFAENCFVDMFGYAAEWLLVIKTNGFSEEAWGHRTATNSRLSSTESIYSADTNSGWNDVSQGYAVAQYWTIE